jgi:hypothetical protein
MISYLFDVERNNSIKNIDGKQWFNRKERALIVLFNKWIGGPAAP